jgi:hypothetical protein
MNDDRIKVLELLADIQFIRQMLEEGIEDKTGAQKVYAEGMIEAYKNVELRIFEKFGLLKD